MRLIVLIISFYLVSCSSLKPAKPYYVVDFYSDGSTQKIYYENISNKEASKLIGHYLE